VTDAAFEFLPGTHDPSGQAQKSAVNFTLDPGRSLAAAVVTVVDEFGAPISSPDLLITDVAFAAIDVVKNIWQVNFFRHNGSPQIYRIQIRWTLDATTPSGVPIGGDKTVLLVCAQT
jgi:hypothetical protein